MTLRKLILAAACLLAPPAAAQNFVAAPWPNASVAWANTSWPGSHDPSGQPNLRPGQWHRIPLPGAAGASNALLHGILVISHGQSAGICEIQVWWRIPGVPGTALAYVSQIISTQPGGGTRVPDSILVPLSSVGEAEMWWDAWPSGSSYPQGCAFGFTYRLQAVVR